MRELLPIAIGLILTACASRSDADRYFRLVEEWQGRTIEFPSVMVDVATGDTIDTGEADFILLTYVDSAGCTACNMKLSLWSIFLDSLDSITGEYEVLPLMVINSDDDRELSYLIRSDAYGYPVIMDKEDSLNSLNHFSEEIHYQTLLLDRNHRVVAVGNPVLKSSVADLYRSIICGSSTFSRNGRQGVKVMPSSVSLGEVSLGAEYTADFMLKNQSRDTVYIRDIISSCHCTTASLADSVILPGATLPVKISLREDSGTGDFARSVHIFYRNFDNPTVLHVSGTVN